MSSESILLTHAEVTAVLAGFAAVAGALRQPLSPVLRQRFVLILLSALASLLSTLIPVWLSESDMPTQALWRLSSAILLGLILAVTVISFLPVRRIGSRVLVIVNLPVTALLNVGALFYIGLLVVNVFGDAPSVVRYYASLLLGLSIQFIVFADAVLQERDGSLS